MAKTYPLPKAGTATAATKAANESVARALPIV